jgi:hypothetical protein
MEKIVKVEIAIANEFNIMLRTEFVVTDLIFTNHNSLLNYKKIVENYRKAIRKSEGFSMLTGTLLIYNAGEYGRRESIELSFRYTHRYAEVKKSAFNGYSYNNFVEADIKNILTDIKELVEAGNKKYLESITYTETIQN